MDQLVNVPLAIDTEHTVPQRALDGGSGLGGLNNVCEPNCPTPSESICSIYNKMSTRGTIRDPFDSPMTPVADRKG